MEADLSAAVQIVLHAVDQSAAVQTIHEVDMRASWIPGWVGTRSAVKKFASTSAYEYPGYFDCVAKEGGGGGRGSHAA